MQMAFSCGLFIATHVPLAPFLPLVNTFSGFSLPSLFRLVLSPILPDSLELLDVGDLIRHDSRSHCHHLLPDDLVIIGAVGWVARNLYLA